MSYTIERNGLHFCVDYYVELLGVLCILCDDQDAICYAGDPICNEAYVRAVKDHFKAADAAKLTKTLESFSKQYWFNYDAPVHLMLMLSNNQPIDKEALFHERRVIPDALFDQFLTDLREFEVASDFAGFYASQLPLYEQIIDHFAADYEHYNSHQYLLHFLNVQPDMEHYINFMVGITNANYGATVDNRVYCNMCPYTNSRYGELPDYSYNPIYYSTLVLHEFAHSFVNRAVAAYRSRIASIDPAPYAQVLDENGYGNSVETLINETIIRAMESLYVKENFSQWYREFVGEYVAEGYDKLWDVIEILAVSVDYEKIIGLFA